ncbi:MAG: RIP metalloprotease RseP [Candidatus Paceibacterota bacterium]
MSIIIFLIILGVLIFVHELGHFSIAKWAKIRVDEFAVGFPPKIISYTKNGTKYALNLIPFGGYVKIFGENPDEESLNPEADNSFVNKSKWIQAAVLIAGITFNIIFAWMLISASYMMSFPAIVNEENFSKVENVQTHITHVAPGSPAENSGLQVGDTIQSLIAGENSLLKTEQTKIEDIQNFIAENSEEEIKIVVDRNDEEQTFSVVPTSGLVEGKKTIGIVMSELGDLQLSFFPALWQGAKTTATLLKETAVGLALFIGTAITGQANLDQVSGPVGIVGHVGDAAQFGFSYLLTFTAFISINLAVINLIPFPALDGGRLLFVAIEGIIKKPIKPKIANTLNLIGFALLMLLMISVTVSDIVKLF